MSFSIQSLYSWYRNTIRNPKYRWWIILGTVVYFLSPLDIAPDFLPIIGEIDDIALVVLLVSEVSQMVIEYAKSRQSGTDTQTTDSTQDRSTTTEATVDVDAVSVK